MNFYIKLIRTYLLLLIKQKSGVILSNKNITKTKIIKNIDDFINDLVKRNKIENYQIDKIMINNNFTISETDKNENIFKISLFHHNNTRDYIIKTNDKDKVKIFLRSLLNACSNTNRELYFYKNICDDLCICKNIPKFIDGFNDELYGLGWLMFKEEKNIVIYQDYKKLSLNQYKRCIQLIVKLHNQYLDNDKLNGYDIEKNNGDIFKWIYLFYNSFENNYRGIYFSILKKIIIFFNNQKSTLVHKDFRQGNIFFFKNSDKIIISDWNYPTKSMGIYDFVYFTTLSNMSLNNLEDLKNVYIKYSKQYKNHPKKFNIHYNCVLFAFMVECVGYHKANFFSNWGNTKKIKKHWEKRLNLFVDKIDFRIIKNEFNLSANEYDFFKKNILPNTKNIIN